LVESSRESVKIDKERHKDTEKETDTEKEENRKREKDKERSRKQRKTKGNKEKCRKIYLKMCQTEKETKNTEKVKTERDMMGCGQNRRR